MKVMKRALALVFMGILAISCLAGCGSNSSDAVSAETEETSSEVSEEKTTVSVALWGAQLLEDYAPWLQEQYPDVEFDFYVATNRTEYYNYCAENGTLPDILTVRKFALRDVEGIRDQLLDLSETDVANSFYQSYLKDYTYSDGTINWLPAAAEIHDILVNKKLFEENNIPLPTDWDSFVYACEEFEKLGIQGYSADFAMDYTCMINLQGFSIGQLTSTDGRAWRSEYESETTDTLDEDVWMPVFEKMLSFLACTGIDESNLDLTAADISTAFNNGEIAMICATGTEITDYTGDFEKMLMPFPGETEDDSWYLTYPAFQIAANASCAEDAEREELIVDIITTMLSEEGLSHISTGKNMVAYNKDVNLELIDELENVEPYVEENKIYIRLASSDMFSISKDVVTKMITGEITTASDAYNAFNASLVDDSEAEQPSVMHLDRSYSHLFENGVGNEAASALYNTMREELGVDFVIGGSAITGADILEGDYTEAEMAYVTVGWDVGPLLKKDMTGSELKEVVQYFLDAKGTRDSVANNSTLPVSGGFEMELSKDDDGYTVEKLTINGEEVSDDQTYSVVVRINYRFDVEDFEAAGFTGYEQLDTKLNTLLKTRLIDEGGQLAEPTDYITVQ